MPFQALYRKYRPQRFDELVGQDHITTALRNAVRDGRVGHAYLFSGPRGNGKTTTARILAKALNCLDLEADGEPCGTCENCVSIAAGTFGDLIEMDAASQRGVYEARDLVSRISLGLGATSKRKVYLLDEVHMLTTAASNTLLKTIEEPPAHVVFILATTEPEKVLATIRSRTQHFEFKYLTVDELSGLLASVLGDEGVVFEPDALAILARAAGGSARDAESLLDLVLATGEGVTVAAVESALGGAPFELRMAILDAIAAEDVAGVLTSVAALLDAAHDPRRIAEGLLRALRDAFVSVATGGRVAIDEPEETQVRLRAMGETMGNAAVVRALETLGQAVVDMRGTDAADPRLVLEIALVRLARRDTANAVQSLADRVERLEARLADGASGATTAASPSTAAPTARSGRSVRPSGTRAERPNAAPAPAASALTAPVPAVPAAAKETSTPRAKPPALGALRRAKAEAGGSEPPAPSVPTPSVPTKASSSGEAASAAPAASDVTFVLDDVIVAWAAVIESLPRSLQTGIMEAQPVRVDGNVIVFGVARTHIDTVKPKFQKDAHSIREAFIRELGSAPRFMFTAHEWAPGDEPPHRRQDGSEPEPPSPDVDPVEFLEPHEFIDAPITEGAAVDSVTRLTDAFGATVVEEQPKS